MKLLLIVLLVTALADPARAQDAKAEVAQQHVFALSGTIGAYSGFGMGVRLGTPAVGVHLLGAWAPLIVSVKEDPPRTNLNFHSTFQGNADAYLLLWRMTEHSEIGLTAGYKYSTHLGHGLGLGGYADVEMAPRWSLFVLAGLTVFPEGTDRLREKGEYDPSTDFVFPGPSWNFGANVGMSFFP